VFIVGFPRSGTTLLQSLLAAHPDVFSLPETFFFDRLVPRRRRDRRLGRPGPRARSALAQLEHFGVPPAPARAGDGLPVGSIGRLAQRFAASLDAAASGAGKRCWVEKTPIHLHRVREIQRYLPDAQIVHMIRAGLPAVASLHAVTHEHPERWGGARSVEQCLDRWRGDLALSHRHVGERGHVFVSYERLVADTPSVVERLCARLGLRSDGPAVDEILGGYGDATDEVVRDEPWKSGVSTGIVNRNDARLAELFSDDERARLARAVAGDDDLLDAIPFV
jgi:hypothetical protein